MLVVTRANNTHDHFEVLFLGIAIQPKFLFFGISMRHFGISGVTTKSQDNPVIFGILGRYAITTHISDMLVNVTHATLE